MEQLHSVGSSNLVRQQKESNCDQVQLVPDTQIRRKQAVVDARYAPFLPLQPEL